jgi:hypothetical protein
MQEGATTAAEVTGYPASTIDHWVRQLNRLTRTAGSLSSSHAPVKFLDLKVSELDWRETLQAIKGTQQVVDNARLGQHDAHVSIQTAEPIVVVPSGDWHLGGYATDYETFEQDLDFILNTPHLYLVDLGDEIDNFTRFGAADAVLNQAIPPDVQKLLMTRILEALAEAGKLLARTWSNHVEGFDERVFGGNIERFNSLCPYLKDDGRLHLHVGGMEYNLLVKHSFPGSSVYNKLHGAKRATRMDWPDADIAISGHTHDGPEGEYFMLGGVTKLAVKVPTYKVNDTWSRRKFSRPTMGVQGIVLYPNEKKFVYFQHVDDAVLFRQASVKHE